MAKYSEKMVEKIVELIEEDNYTTTEICRILGIGRNIFYKWKSEKPEFSRALNEAIASREEKLQLQARKSIRQKLEGYRQVETKTTYVASKDNPNELTVKEYVVKEKYHMPETSAITLALGKSQSEGSKGKPLYASNQSPLSIVVNDQKTKSDLELLQQRMDSTSAETGGAS